MDLNQLKKYLENLIKNKNLKPKNKKFLNAKLGSLKSVFPFNEYEYILMFENSGRHGIHFPYTHY